VGLSWEFQIRLMLASIGLLVLGVLIAIGRKMYLWIQ